MLKLAYINESATNLIFVLTFGDVLTADLDSGRQETLEKIGAVQTQQVCDALRLCTVITHAPFYTARHANTSLMLRA